jgi:pimeloyl-ACP methyl ester carboxylesterase
VLVDVDAGVQLDVEVLGAENAPAVLLLGGAGWSRDWWDDELCARLVARGRRVIRYDQRDTGASTCWPVGAPGYSGQDLVTDAVAVLDAAGVARAHVVGLSAGGGTAQELAVARRERIASLTLIATTAIDPVGELPGPTPAIRALFADEGPGPDWSDPEAAVTALVEGERPFAGPDAFDEARTRAIAERVVARSRDLAASTTNPFLVAAGDVGGPTGLRDLADLPVLVVHGTADPVFPVEHGRALAAAIPGARLLELEGMGHQVPPESMWDRFVDALPGR